MEKDSYASSADDEVDVSESDDEASKPTQSSKSRVRPKFRRQTSRKKSGNHYSRDNNQRSRYGRSSPRFAGKSSVRRNVGRKARLGSDDSAESEVSLVKAKRKYFSSDDDDGFFIFSKEWRSKDRRERRFTKHSVRDLHKRAEEVKRSQRLRDREREERLYEMEDVLEDMEDHINEYKSRKEVELQKKKSKIQDFTPNAWKKYPKPGSKPKVTFKPEKFLIRQGFLYKKGLKWRRWQKRYFRIFLDEPHSLYYYKSPRKADEDSRMRKTMRKGKKINLLFANVNEIKKYGRHHKGYHKNQNIIREHEFFIQTKSVKKVNLGENKGFKTRTVLGRVFFLCSSSVAELNSWLDTLKYVEKQTERCIKEHKEQIKEGQDLKRAYFESLKKGKKPKKKSDESEKNEEDEEKEASKRAELDEKDQKKWDRAQMISVYGNGIAEAVAGKKARFMIDDNFQPPKAKKGKKQLNGFLSLQKLNVVLETEELHYDLEPQRLGRTENKFFCEYLCTRRGEYELSVLYDGFDVYGSPFKVRISPAALSASHCFLSGQNYILSHSQTQQINLNLRNVFEEKVGIRKQMEQVRFEITSSPGIELKNLDEINNLLANIEEESASVIPIQYSVDISKLGANEANSEANLLNGTISVKIDDKLSTPSFMRAVRNSPFVINVLLQNNFQQQQQPLPTYSVNEDVYGDMPLQDANESTVEAPRSGYFNAAQSPEIDVSPRNFGENQGDGFFSPRSMFQNSPSAALRRSFSPEDFGRPSISKTLKSSRQSQRSFASSSTRNDFSIPQETAAFDRRLLKLFEKHESVLRAVFRFYSRGSSFVALEGLLQLGIDYDIVPTFISKKEVFALFNRLPQKGGLEYDWFLVCLAEIAIFSLSKPMFAHLYNTDKSKVNVLLNMWGIADASKITSIRSQA